MQKIQTFGIISIILLLWGCANVQRPPGGPPDKEPPKILSAQPVSRTKNFTGKSVTLEFSEYVNRQKARENIFISPPAKVEYDWSGRELEIEFDGPLAPQTTYAVTVGTDYTDLAGNKPTESYTLIFATGDQLDSGIVRGRLIDENPTGAFIFLYPLSGMQADTLNPAHTKPKYKVQAGANGAFEFQALKKGGYRLFAVRDEFRDDLFNEGTDAFGTPAADLFLEEGGTAETTLRIAPAKDISPPRLYGATALSEQLIRAEFSEKLDTASISEADFMVQDTTGKKSSPVIRSAYISTSKQFAVDLYLATPLPPDRDWKLTATSVRDSAGNPIADSLNTAFFRSSTTKDSTVPKPVQGPLKDSTTNIAVTMDFPFVFNVGIDSTSLSRSIQLTLLSGVSVPFDLVRINANSIIVRPRALLQNNSWYVLSLHAGMLKAINGLSGEDTTLKFRFQTQDIGTFGTISGTLEDPSGNGCTYVLVLLSKDKKNKITRQLTTPGTWEFKDIPPGSYSLSVFCDTDNNGAYSYGRPFPYQPAERFADYPGDIVVRPRWTVEKIHVVLH